MSKHDLINAPDSAEAEAPRTVHPAPVNTLVGAESRRLTHHHIPAPGVQFGDLAIPEYWSLVAPKLHIWDLIECEDFNGAWFAILQVREVGAEFAKTIPILKVDLPRAVDVDDVPRGHRVDFLGPTRLWAVLRGQQVIRHGFSTRTDAVGWLQGMLR